MSPREFSTDWVGAHTPKWLRLLAHLVDKPGAMMLEVGAFEGRSACWWAEKIFTGEGARVFCVDPWGSPGPREVFERNTAELRAAGRIVMARGTVLELERYGPPARFDAAYIDGDHTAEGVLTDLTVAWPRLHVGGVMIFDDYEHGPDTYADMREAIDWFLGLDAVRFELLGRAVQVSIAKIADGPLPFRVCHTHGVAHARGFLCGR
jgi:predicted O-methyltransferase YrrM